MVNFFKKKLIEIYKHRGDYLFITPAIILFLVFIIYPVFRNLYISFFDFRLRDASHFVGMTNYFRVFSDRIFLRSLIKSIIFMTSVTILSVLFGFIASLLVNNLVGSVKYFVRSSIFIPTIASLIVTAMIWRSLLEPGGFVESAGKLVGIIMPSWLSDPNLTIVAVIIISTWQRLGYNMIFFLAGLQTIPQMFYEAAEVDGASKWVQFRSITIPLLQHTTLFIIVVNTLQNLRIFEQVMAFTGGGPMQATMTAEIHIFNTAFRYARFGYAAAMAIVFSIFAFSIAVFQIRFFRSEVEY